MRIGVLGDIVFEVSQSKVYSPESLRRQSTWKYAEHEIIKGKSRLQKLGRQLDTVSLTLRFVDYFCVPLAEVKRLKEQAEKKEPLTLVIGDEVFGDFVIESIAETWVETDGNGNPRLIEVEVQLKEYY